MSFMWGNSATSCPSVFGLAEQAHDLFAAPIAQGRAGGFEVQPEQRLGVAGAHVEPPPLLVAEIAEFDGDAVELILPPVLVPRLELGDRAVLVGDVEVDLAGGV